MIWARRHENSVHFKAPIGVTTLILLYPKLSTPQIVGTDIVHAVPLTFAAGIGHWLLDSTDFYLFVSLILGSIPAF